MGANQVTRILVGRDGHSFDDGTICDGDEVKCDGWQYMRDLALYEAVQIGVYDPSARLVGLPTACSYEWGTPLESLGRAEDWAVTELDPYQPKIYTPGEFRAAFEFAGVRDGIRLYRRTRGLRAFQWNGAGNLTLYSERASAAAPGKSGQAVKPGDWVCALEDGSYRAISAKWAEIYLDSQ